MSGYSRRIAGHQDGMRKATVLLIAPVIQSLMPEQAVLTGRWLAS